MFAEYASAPGHENRRPCIALALASSGSIDPMGAAPADDDDANNLWQKSSWYSRITRHTITMSDTTLFIENIDDDPMNHSSHVSANVDALKHGHHFSLKNVELGRLHNSGPLYILYSFISRREHSRRQSRWMAPGGRMVSDKRVQSQHFLVLQLTSIG
jgi:hypothetical protein